MDLPHIDEFNLNEWIDGMLPEVESEQIVAHLATCATCRQKANELRSLSLLFDDLCTTGSLETVPSLDFALNVIAAIENRSSTTAPMPWKTLMAQVAVVLTLSASLGSFFLQRVLPWQPSLVHYLPEIQLRLWGMDWWHALITWRNDLWMGTANQFANWTQQLPTTALPELSLSLWLPLLALSCLLWLAATRWLIFTNGIHSMETHHE